MKNKNKNKFYAGFYNLLAVVLMILGLITLESYYFYGAIVLVLCSFYWMWKVAKK